MMRYVSPIHRRVVGHAARRPDRIALRHDGSGYPYGALAQRSRRAATVLAGCGVRPGDRVAAFGRGDAAFFEILLGCGILGAVFVPMNDRWDAATGRAVLSDSRTALVIDPEPAARVAAANVLAAEDLDRGIIRSAPAPVPGMLPADRPAMLCYSWDGTGEPHGAVLTRGVVLTHGDLVARAAHGAAEIGLSAKDIALPVKSPAHPGALGGVILPALIAGARLVLPVGSGTSRLMSLAGGEAATVLLAGPEDYTRLSERQGFDGASLPALRAALTDGRPVPSAVRERLAARGIPLRSSESMAASPPGFAHPDICSSAG